VAGQLTVLAAIYPVNWPNCGVAKQEEFSLFSSQVLAAGV